MLYQCSIAYSSILGHLMVIGVSWCNSLLISFLPVYSPSTWELGPAWNKRWNLEPEGFKLGESLADFRSVA